MFSNFCDKSMTMTSEEIKFFDKISEKWDEEEIMSTPDRVKEIIELSRIDKGMKILDLGTGTGILIPYLAAAVGKEGEIKGIDISKGMLEKAVKKYGDIKNVTFELRDFEKETIEGRYDLIFLYCVYPHLHTPVATINALIKNNLKEKEGNEPDHILKEGGRIIIGFPADEEFVNNIHHEKKAESDLLPPADKLCKRLRLEGLNASVISQKNPYLLEIKA